MSYGKCAICSKLAATLLLPSKLLHSLYQCDIPQKMAALCTARSRLEIGLQMPQLGWQRLPVLYCHSQICSARSQFNLAVCSLCHRVSVSTLRLIRSDHRQVQLLHLSAAPREWLLRSWM